MNASPMSSAEKIWREIVGGQAGPFGDDQHAIGVAIGAGRIDDEGAAELAEGHRRPQRRRPVVIGTGPAGGEAHLADRPRGHVERRARRAVAAAQAVHAQRRGQFVGHRHRDRRALGDPQERRRHHQRLADFAEGLDVQGGSVRRLRRPASAPGAQRQRKRPGVEGAGRPAVVVGHDSGCPAIVGRGRRGGRRRRGMDEQDERQGDAVSRKCTHEHAAHDARARRAES